MGDIPERKGQRSMARDNHYLDNADGALGRWDHFIEPEKARLEISAAQAYATQAVALAIEHLAEAVENLRNT